MSSFILIIYVHKQFFFIFFVSKIGHVNSPWYLKDEDFISDFPGRQATPNDEKKYRRGPELIWPHWPHWPHWLG